MLDCEVSELNLNYKMGWPHSQTSRPHTIGIVWSASIASLQNKGNLLSFTLLVEYIKFEPYKVTAILVGGE